MKKIKEQELKTIIGGASLSATMINAFTNIFKVLLSSGIGLGSAMRRIGEGKTCPLN